MNVRAVVSTMVSPKTLTPQSIIWSSNLDAVIPSDYVKTVYFYKPDGSSNFFSLDILREALSAALVPFYPLAGRLQIDPNGRPEINCNGAGVLLVQAAADTRIEHLGDFDPGFLQLIPKVEDSQDPTARPLVNLQVTFFQCGGVSLGVGVHHQIADGRGWIYFLNTWSDLARGVAPSLQPVFDRTPLKPRSPPVPMFQHVEYQPSHQPRLPQKEETSNEAPANRLDARTFKFSKEYLQELKACSCKSMVKYSTYEILAGHIWRCFCEAREVSPDQETKLYISTDGRLRLRPPLPEGYIGNAIFMATPVLTAGDVMAKPLHCIAGEIHEAIERMNDEYLRSAIDFLELKPDVCKLVLGDHTTRSPNLSIVSWANLPIYECDFGWGKPMLVTPARLMLEGLVFVLPSPTSDGSLSVCVAMEAHRMLRLKGLLLQNLSADRDLDLAVES